MVTASSNIARTEQYFSSDSSIARFRADSLMPTPVTTYSMVSFS